MIIYCRYTILMTCIVFFLFIVFCTSNSISGSGGGIDIGNPTKLCVVDSLNRPVAHASVKVILSDRWFTNIFSGNTAVYDNTSTNTSGDVDFNSLPMGTYNIQVDHPSGGAFVADVHMSDSLSVNVITIRNYGTITGRVSSNSGIPATIRLSGTDYSAPINTQGMFTLSGIAQGTCTPVIMAVDSSWTFANTITVTPSNVSTSNKDVVFNSLLINDFEDSGSTLSIGQFVKGSYIYARQAVGSAQYEVVAEGNGGGKVLKGTLITQKAYALIGFSLGIKPVSDSLWDFSTAKGLSFFAKGSGKLNISIESDTIDKMGSYKHYSADIILQPEWHNFTLPFDSLKFKEDSNPAPDITWEKSARSIKRIEFNALEGDTIQFLLDDLRVDGIGFSEVY